MLLSRFLARSSAPVAATGLRCLSGGASAPVLIPSAVSIKRDFREKLAHAKALSLEGGGAKRVETQHKKGKLTARERLLLLLDENSFRELDQLKTHRCDEFGMEKEVYYGDGVITGHGLIHGRKVFVFSQDFTVFGGSLSETHAQKICKVSSGRVQRKGG